MRLTHNLAALNVYRAYSKSLDKQSASMERISSGYKVNSAKDDPNELAQSERMRMQIRGMQMASKNVQDGVSMVQTAEGGLENITAMLQRVRELTVQASDDSNSDADKGTVQNEIKSILDGIDNIAKGTQINGVNIIGRDEVINNDDPKYIQMPIGANVDEKVNIPVFNVSTLRLKDPKGLALSNIDVTTQNGATNALSCIDSALDTVVSISNRYGAIENRLQSTYDSLQENDNVVAGSESSIRDVDITQEMIEVAKSNILVDAGNAMMVQANRFPQDVLNILNNVRGR